MKLTDVLLHARCSLALALITQFRAKHTDLQDWRVPGEDLGPEVTNEGDRAKSRTTAFLMKEAARDLTKVEDLFLPHFTNLGENTSSFLLKDGSFNHVFLSTHHVMGTVWLSSG